MNVTLMGSEVALSEKAATDLKDLRQSAQQCRDGLVTVTEFVNLASSLGWEVASITQQGLFELNHRLDTGGVMLADPLVWARGV